MYSTRNIAAALGGQVAGPNAVLCPGPGHSPRDRSLAVRLDPAAPDGFLVHSHSWRRLGHVSRLRPRAARLTGMAARRRTTPRHSATVFGQMGRGTRPSGDEGMPRTFTEDEIARIENASRLWDEGKDPRGTLAEKYLRESAQARSAGQSCRHGAALSSAVSLAQ